MIMEPFQRLPAELVSQIIRHTADFAGVDSLTTVSRQARAVFQVNSCSIIQDLISSNSITSQPEIKKLLSSIALLHRPSIYCASLDEYMQLANGDKGALGSPSCQQQEDSDLVFRIFHIAAQTQRLACACLSTLRQRLATAIGTSSTRTQKANHPFSYLEEYRVYWALWQLRCYSDLRNAAGQQNWVWSREEINKPDAYTSLNGIHDFMAEQIWTVAAVLVELGPCLASSSIGESQELQHASTVAWDLAPNTPMPFFSSFELARSIEKDNPMLWPPPQPPIEDPVTNAWKLTLPYCNRPSGQTMLFRSLRQQASRGRPDRPPSAAMDDISAYRRSGVLLWDLWRMYSTGLMPNTFRERRPTPDGGFVEPSCGAVAMGDVLPAWLEIAGVK